jgi:hypothetical protein
VQLGVSHGRCGELTITDSTVRPWLTLRAKTAQHSVVAGAKLESGRIVTSSQR